MNNRLTRKALPAGLILLALAAGAAGAESVRLGAVAGVDLRERPTCQGVVRELDGAANLIPGFYAEVLIDHVGIGLTGLGRFERVPADLPAAHTDWFFDWIGSFDARYHFLRGFVLDPFVEAGLGSAGRVEIAGEEGGVPPEDRQPLQLSLFAQVGAGLALRLDGAHVGAKMSWRFLNDPPPATRFEPYPLRSFRVDLFAGFSI